MKGGGGGKERKRKSTETAPCVYLFLENLFVLCQRKSTAFDKSVLTSPRMGIGNGLVFALRMIRRNPYTLSHRDDGNVVECTRNFRTPFLKQYRTASLVFV